ncbi:MAG: RNA 2',3'-cyclic phosphodiesterase [Ignavibacteriae bacterium]|nr:RNA 2',3'-cyclic phosphodiesterase [Ignavibacteriota bacterium]
MNTIRTFIAVDTPEEFKSEISNVQDVLKVVDSEVRWEKEKKFHITLKFLGDVKERIMPGLLSHIETVLRDFSSFELTYGTFGCFPNMKFPKIIWVGAHNADGKLLEIQTTIEDELISFGFKKEKNPFTPHITIGRVKGQKNIRDLVSIMEKLTFTPRTFHINEIVVMKSVLQPSGSEYEIIQTIQLQQ